jgi:membrane-bound metal-dependent hydrolase YbcI (DUF457 family)
LTGKGHTLTGLVFCFAAYKFSNSIEASGVIAGLFTIIGSTAPDWLELRSKKGGTFIKHRTITHWLPVWLLMFLYAYSQFVPSSLDFIKSIPSIYNALSYKLNMYVGSGILGFSIGGLLHLLFDLPNPMGIPILTPYHRFSLKLWKSGKFENTIVFSVLIFTLYYLNLISFNIDALKQF